MTSQTNVEVIPLQVVSSLVHNLLERHNPKTFVLITCLGAFVLLLLRSTQSIGRLPSDPGYDYIAQGNALGLGVLTVGDPYFHLVARTIGFITASVPLIAQAIVLAILVHVVWALCAGIITTVVKRETDNSLLAMICGMALVLVPHASESGIGNVGNVKWPIFAALIVVGTSGRLILRDVWWVIPLTLLSGLTQPLSLLVLLPLSIKFLTNRKMSQVEFGLFATLIVTVVAQLIKVGVNTAASGQSNKVTTPWDGMGLFWWTGLMAPSLIALTCIAIWVVVRNKQKTDSLLVPLLGMMTILVALTSYQLGGIGDRYFIVPMTLAMILTMIVTWNLSQLFPRWKIVLVVCVAFGILGPSFKWFSTGWYMTSGPTWASEIRRARMTCRSSPGAEVQVLITPSGTADLSCDDVLND